MYSFTVDVVPSSGYNFLCKEGLLAQLGERLGHNQEVVGSSPAQTTRKMKPCRTAGFFCSGLDIYQFFSIKGMTMIKILAVGNSFSRDALFYLSEIGAANGQSIKAVNLFIPGCSLEQHWMHIVNDDAAYIYEENGYTTEKKISIRQALESNDWDFIVTQQSSGFSGLVETYFPYLEQIAEYIRANSESSEFLLHQTWAYEKNYRKPVFKSYHYDQDYMYKMLSKTYQYAADRLKVRLIPSGEVIQKMRRFDPFIFESGGRSLCRDGRHMDYLYGRYLLGAVWYRFLTGKPLRDNPFIPHIRQVTDEICDESILRFIRQKVDEIVR